MHIAEKLIDGRKYYYIQHSYRLKDQKGNRSKVKTDSVYLGTAEKLLARLNEAKRPLEVEHKDFGFIAALLQVSQEIGLIELLQSRIPGERFGVPRWMYFFLTVINRLQRATSKEQMGAWAQKTILPEFFGIDLSSLNSKQFWCATEDIVSEAELKVKRSAKALLAGALTTGIPLKDEYVDAASMILEDVISDDKLKSVRELISTGITEDNVNAARAAKTALTDDLFAGIDESVFHDIVHCLFGNIKKKFGIPQSVTLYDTTNFFTYIDEPTNSKLAKTGHSKEFRHHLRQVGLALATDKLYGIPFFYRVYRGNSHDSKTFGAVVDTLIDKIKTTYPDVEDLVLVLDKGNNSKENFQHLAGKVKWVGSLVPTHYADLLKVDLEEYVEQYQGILYFSVKKKIMGIDCLVVSTYRPSLARRQALTLYTALVKLTDEIQEKFDGYKNRPTTVPIGIKSMLKESRYGKFLDLSVHDGKLTYRLRLARKENPLHAELAKLTNRIQEKFDAYKNRPAVLPVGVKSILEESVYGKFLDLSVNDRQLSFSLREVEENEPATTELDKAKQRFGKNVIFTDHINAEASWVIDHYQGKQKIEDCFSLMKSADLIRFRPIRHFTDTKICSFAFCCVIALMLVRVLELRCAQSGLPMTAELIKDELTDLKAVTMIYGPKDVTVEITKRSTVQQKLWDLLGLGEVASRLPYIA